MPKRDIRTTIALDGEKEYKASLNDAMQAVKLLGLEVKENTTTYGKNSDSVKGNRELVSLLQKEIAKQEEIVASLTEKVAQSAKEHGENSKQTQEYQEKLIKARTALAAMNNEVDGANKRIPTFGDKVKDVSAKLGTGLVTAAKAAAAATAAAMAAVGAAAISAGKAIYELTGQAGQYADTILTMSQQTGVAAEDLQKWEYAGQFIDTSVETITGSLTKLTKNMASNSAETSEAFATLGVSITDSTGQMRDDQEVFWEIIDALGTMTNETERDQLSMQLLGKSAQDLNPLIIAGSDAFRQLGDEAKSAGLIMSEDSLNAFGAYDDAVNTMKTTLTAAGRSIAEVFLPATQSVVGGVTEVVQAFIGMVQGAEGAKDKFKASIKDLINKVTDMINDWLPDILEMGMEILMSLVEGLLDALPKLTAALPKIITTLVNFVVDNLPQIIESGIQIIIALAQGLIAAIPNLVAKLPQIIAALVKGLATGVSEMAKIGLQLIQGLWEGIKNSFNWIKDKITGWVGDVWAFIKRLFGISSPSKYGKEIGANVGSSIGMGITGSKDSVQSAIDDLLPSTQPMKMKITRTVATQVALATPAFNPQLAASGAVGNLSDTSINKLANGIVSAIRKSGMADAAVVLDGREIGRYMRRGLEVGFVQ